MSELVLAAKWAGVNRAVVPSMLRDGESPSAPDACPQGRVHGLLGPRRGRALTANYPMRIMGVGQYKFPSGGGKIITTDDMTAIETPAPATVPRPTGGVAYDVIDLRLLPDVSGSAAGTYTSAICTLANPILLTPFRASSIDWSYWKVPNDPTPQTGQVQFSTAPYGASLTASLWALVGATWWEMARLTWLSWKYTVAGTKTDSYDLQLRPLPATAGHLNGTLSAFKSVLVLNTGYDSPGSCTAHFADAVVLLERGPLGTTFLLGA